MENHINIYNILHFFNSSLSDTGNAQRKNMTVGGVKCYLDFKIR